MNKNIIYIVLALLLGLVGGYFIFGNTVSSKMDTEMTADHDHSVHSENQQWTCAMHPQIKLPEAGSCPICAMDLIPATTSMEGIAQNEIQLTENAMALANVQTSIVGEGTMTDGTMTLSGTIVANEEMNTVQVSYFEGRIEQLYVSYEGQDIRKGQLLARIYAPELVAAQQELITAAALKTSQPSLYRAVRNKLKLWKLSEKQINGIEQSGEIQDRIPIYATVNGTVGTVMTAEGDYVQQGQALLKLNKLTSVWAEFDAYENQLSQLKEGTAISIRTNAYPNMLFKAKISFIDPVLNTQTRTVTVRATLNNTKRQFKPGMFVSGKLKGDLNKEKTKITIPATAILWTGKRSLVYVKTDPQNPIFEMREVTIGDKIGDNYSILSGIELGETVVTNGAFTVDAAAQLQGKKSMMNKNGGKTSTGHEGHGTMNKELKDEESMTMGEIKMTEVIQTDFQELLASYLKIKDALVAGDVTKVSVLAKVVEQKSELKKKRDSEKEKKQHFSMVIERFRTIAENENLKNQRDQFIVLSEHMIALAKTMDHFDDKIYVQHCPMADNNQGALWLSSEVEIQNPYFGEAMLTCGSVQETFL